MTDLTTWVNNTALILLSELPLQSLDSAIAYASSYLSDIGGWVPDDPLFPNGEGEPANGFTEQQAADAITQIEYSQVYDLNFDVTITLNAQLTMKLGTGLDLTGATNAMRTTLEEFVTDRINNSDIPLRLDTVVTEAAVAGNSQLTGITTSAIRTVIDAAIGSGDKIVDFKALALKFARDTYGIDDTWNVKSIYTETNSSIVVIIAKYTNNTWTALDGTETTIYVFTISPETYEIVAGAIIDQGP